MLITTGQMAITIDLLKKVAATGFETAHIDETFGLLRLLSCANAASVLSDSEHLAQIELPNKTLGEL